MSVTTDDFLKRVLRSGLMDRAQLQDALRGVPSVHRADPRTLADQLVNLGVLSSFQVAKIFKGTTLGLRLGQYNVLSPIGKGGMGTVYLALDTRTELHVAVKVLPPKLASKKSHYLARFLREMEISQKVSHPNLARSYSSGEDHGVYYIAMEYIPGVSLTRLVKSGPLSVARAARLFTEVAAALEHAHGLNIIHRDLKPSNIMITPNDHAKVLDLGLAILEGEKQNEPVQVIGGKGYLVGSLDYMAPEQTENSSAVDARSDIYALGCSLYFAVTGKAPFAGGDKRDKVHAQRHLEAFPAHHRNPAVPETFSYLLERLMAKNPEKRPQTARAVRDELLPWCPVENARPMDELGDANYKKAVTRLAQAPLSDDQLAEEPIVPQASRDSPLKKVLNWSPLRRTVDVVVGGCVVAYRAVLNWILK